MLLAPPLKIHFFYFDLLFLVLLGLCIQQRDEIFKKIDKKGKKCFLCHRDQHFATIGWFGGLFKKSMIFTSESLAFLNSSEAHLI